MTKEEYERRKAKVLKLRKQVLTMVEELIEPEIDEAALIEKCRYLCKNDYHDVTVERSILDYCGYPLCTNGLTGLSKKKQQYKICLQTHQVFDITDRKMFCSNLCFGKLNHLKGQLEDEALWLRDLDDSKPAKLTTVRLCKKSKGSYGEEVRLDINLTKDLIEELHKEGDSLQFKIYCKDCRRNGAADEKSVDEKSTDEKSADEKSSDKQPDSAKASSNERRCSNEKCRNRTTGVKLDKSINFPYIQEDDLESLKDKLKSMKIKERKPNVAKNGDLADKRPIKDEIVEKFDKISLKNLQ